MMIARVCKKQTKCALSVKVFNAEVLILLGTLLIFLCLQLHMEPPFYLVI